MKHPLITGLIGWLGVASTALAMNDCAHHAERNLDIDAAGIESIELLARAGDLDIRGEAGLQRIIVRGKACASDEQRLQAVQLVSNREGDMLSLVVSMPEDDGSWFGNAWQRLDLDVRVPARLALNVADTSGDASIRGVARASVQDSSGDLDIADIAGDLAVTDSSGDIDIRTVGGSLQIPSDGSGDIEVVGVGGNATVDRDGSGDIVLRGIGGDARVDDDGSGDVRVFDITGSFSVGDDGSGDIVANGVGGDFVVDSDGSGSVRGSDVAGATRIPTDD